MTDRPNIVYLTTDGHRADATGFDGNPLAPGGFMDEMAGQGIGFTDAYAVSPICTPSRCSVFTGVHPLVHAVTCHQNRAPHNLPQLAELLMQGGYYTAAAGHYEQIRNLGRGYHEQVDEATRGPLRRAYDLWQSSGRDDVGWDSGRLACSAEQGQAHLLTDRVIRMLDPIQAAQMPFFLHVSYYDPHPPCFTPPPYDTMIDPARVPLPRRNDGPDQPAWQKRVSRDFGAHLAAEQDLRKLIAVYYGMIAYANDQMRRLHQALAARGLLENTWFVIASDHGDYGGDKGLFSHTESLYECLLRVPLIIRPPDHVTMKRGLRVGGLVELVDLFPTMLKIAGQPVPDYAQGRDLMEWVCDGARQPLRDCAFAQAGDYHGHLDSTLRGGRPKSARHPGLLQGVRTAEFSYVRDSDFGDEAYDLHRDPHELHNLLAPGSGREPAEVADLRRRVEQWEARCLNLRKQLGVIPGYRGFDPGWE